MNNHHAALWSASLPPTDERPYTQSSRDSNRLTTFGGKRSYKRDDYCWNLNIMLSHCVLWHSKKKNHTNWGHTDSTQRPIFPCQMFHPIHFLMTLVDGWQLTVSNLNDRSAFNTINSLYKGLNPVNLMLPCPKSWPYSLSHCSNASLHCWTCCVWLLSVGYLALRHNLNLLSVSVTSLALSVLCLKPKSKRTCLSQDFRFLSRVRVHQIKSKSNCICHMRRIQQV